MSVDVRGWVMDGLALVEVRSNGRTPGFSKENAEHRICQSPPA